MSTPVSGAAAPRADEASAIPDRPRTLAEKNWDYHLVATGQSGEPDLIYIDLHLVHEVTSPQAFDGLRADGSPRASADLTIATEDHNTPTLAIDKPIADPTSARRSTRCVAMHRKSSACDCIRLATRSRGSCTWSGRSWALPCLASRSFAATRTRPRTVRSVRWRSASARARSSMSWPRRRCR